MTKVEFHFNVARKPQKITQLAQAILARKQTLTIHVPDEASSTEISHHLWTHDPTSFLPHSLGPSDACEMSSIALDWQGSHLPFDDVLLNLSPVTPLFFSRFQKVIEVVGLDEVDRANARERFKFYRDRGYEINTIDAQEKR